MTLSRRKALGLGAASIAATGMVLPVSFNAWAQNATTDQPDFIDTPAGSVSIFPVAHASLVLAAPGLTIYADPVGDVALYEALPPADLLLVTHEHGDHYNAGTLGALLGESTELITNPAVYGKLPDDLKSRATPLANGETTETMGVTIDAVPAYNTSPDRQQFHPQGRDNGYVLNLGGSLIYIAGDTEDIPAMRSLSNIALAFVPMVLPYTMDVDQAASAVLEFAPKVVYPYHYRGSDIDRFKSLVEAGGPPIEVRFGPWYEDA